MMISIGILAHNEERFIGATIALLLAQSIFRNPKTAKEIIVIANGCSDATVAAAANALREADSFENCRTEVRDISEPGKANAWNVFIHEASAKSADYFVLLDADIEFENNDAIERLIRHLEADAALEIAPDQPVKKFASRGPFSALVRLMQKTGSDGDTALSGQLYAARAQNLRSIVMPRGIVVEDGYLRAMTLTRNFTEGENRARIRRAPGVRHFYAPYESLGDVYRYERRQAAGTAINRFVYREIERWRSVGLDPFAEIARLNEESPDWLEELIAEEAASGLIALPGKYVLRRLRRRDNWRARRIFKAPLLLAATLFDLVVAFDATRQLKNRRSGKRWETIRDA
ncbi:MAG TPA: glycosyltransferase family A protein [Parvularculaceae bacterium]|nr:glycosyltransferase family A protein [Parvularculaceae bacterium]HNS87300.1 glycosyltransferase family A protein [Parvularculaceae bacterium]